MQRPLLGSSIRTTTQRLVRAMSTTKLDFTNASSLRSGASALLIGSQSLLQDTFQTSRASTATLDTFKPLLQPVLSGQTKVNSAWNEGYVSLRTRVRCCWEDIDSQLKRSPLSLLLLPTVRRRAPWR